MNAFVPQKNNPFHDVLTEFGYRYASSEIDDTKQMIQRYEHPREVNYYVLVKAHTDGTHVFIRWGETTENSSVDELREHLTIHQKATAARNAVELARLLRRKAQLDALESKNMTYRNTDAATLKSHIELLNKRIADLL